MIKRNNYFQYIYCVRFFSQVMRVISTRLNIRESIGYSYIYSILEILEILEKLLILH